MTEQKPKKLTGFALHNEQKRKEIASLGGKKAHENGNAHKFTSEKAKEASKKRRVRTQSTDEGKTSI